MLHFLMLLVFLMLLFYSITTNLKHYLSQLVNTTEVLSNLKRLLHHEDNNISNFTAVTGKKHLTILQETSGRLNRKQTKG